jgi:hypothetical protein
MALKAMCAFGKALKPTSTFGNGAETNVQLDRSNWRGPSVIAK